jgi:hypothetical protein
LAGSCKITGLSIAGKTTTADEANCGDTENELCHMQCFESGFNWASGPDPDPTRPNLSPKKGKKIRNFIRLKSLSVLFRGLRRLFKMVFYQKISSCKFL